MAVLVVVPAEEVLAVRPGGLDRAEPRGKRRPVLQGLELRFGVRVVVGDVRAGVGLGDAQVGQQQRDRLGRHGAAAVGVQAELAAGDALLGARLRDELVGQGGGLAGRDHPADRVAAVDVQDDVEVVVGPFGRAVQLGDVPGADLVRPGGRELGLDRRRVHRLAPPLPAFAGLAQHPVVSRHRAEVGALVQQHRPDLVRGQVSEPRAVQRLEDCLPLGRGQRPRLEPLLMRDRSGLRRRRADPVPPVPAGLRHPGRAAGCPGADLRCEQGDGLVGQELDPCSVSAPSEIVSKSACSFDCTSATKRALASSWSSLAFSFRSRAICASRGSAGGRPTGCFSPASAPASRARRHSVIRLEYRPSRRRIAPFSPGPAAS